MKEKNPYAVYRKVPIFAELTERSWSTGLRQKVVWFKKLGLPMYFRIDYYVKVER